MRDTIFISHANPQDNYFASWLATKLKLLGYKVWVDIKDIKPGQYFNQDFEKVIRESAVKFLAVISNDYLVKSNTPDTGVMNEILHARTIKDVNDFIIPLRYDSSDFNAFGTGMIGRQAISFHDNWAVGLHDLVSHLEELNIPKSQEKDDVMSFWHEAQKIKSIPLDKPEKYFTNWFPVDLPDYVYVHQPEVFIEQEIYSMPFTVVREADRLITFTSDITTIKWIPLKKSIKIPIDRFLRDESIEIDNLVLQDTNKKLVRLLNKNFKNFLFKKGLKRYLQSNKKEIFYYPYTKENAKMINLKQLGKSRRSIIGNATDFIWHFAISHSAAIVPSSCFKIFYHIVFTDLHSKPLPPEEQHELRRSMPSGWFNRKWLETLLAFMLKISDFDINHQIKIPIDDNQFLTVNAIPFDIISSVGYKEPNSEVESPIL